MTQPFSAKDLLAAFLDLRGLTPDLNHWNERRLAGNLPRLIRLRRLKALFRALQIPWDPAAFASGQFIDPANTCYSKVLKSIVSTLPDYMRDRGEDDFAGQMQDCFETLFRFRVEVQSVLTSGVMEAGGLYLFAERKKEDLRTIVKQNVSAIDDVLLAFISPESRTFTLDEMLRDYGYPEDDLSAIDADSW